MRHSTVCPTVYRVGDRQSTTELCQEVHPRDEATTVLNQDASLMDTENKEVPRLDTGLQGPTVLSHTSSAATA